MNVISRMITDHKRRADAEASGFVFEEKDRFSVKKVRNGIVGFLLFLIVILAGLQFGMQPNTSTEFTEQLVAVKPERDLPHTTVEPKVSEPLNSQPLSVIQDKQPMVLASNTVTEKITPKKQPAIPAKPKATPKVQAKVAVAEKIKPAPKAKPVARIDKRPPPNQPVKVASKPLQPVKIAKANATPPEVPKSSPAISKKVHKPSKIQLAQTTYAAGLKLVKKRKLSKAKEYMQRALELNPQHFKARELLAGIHIRRKESVEATNVLLDGVKNNPSYFKFRQLLARLYVDQNQSEQALLILDDATDLQKQSARYHGMRAAVSQGMGKFRDAISSYDAALAVQPNEARWWLGLGLSHESVEQYHDAEAAYIKAGQLSSLSADMRQYVEQRLTVVRLHTTASM